MAETPWTVTRLELLYYSRLHKRWQIWQEAVKADEGTGSQSSEPGELHRSQMFSLLSTVRATLAEVSERSGFNVDDSMRNIKEFRIGAGGLRDVLAAAPKFWQGYLQYIRETSRNYGIKEGGPLDVFLRNERLIKLEPYPLNITREVALDLISMLPVLRHWDLQGCWFRAVSHPEQEYDSFVPKARNGARWTHPFYMASIREQPAKTNSDGTILTESPLSVELMFEDLDFFDRESCPWSPQYLEPRDFFECCHKPKSGDDLLLYQCYSFLFDKLRQMLNPEGDFFIAYPIQVLGRLNFLHIWVRGEEGRQLKELWDFWFNSSNTLKPSVRKSPHIAFWSRARDFLHFNLPGIARSTFQAAWQRAMATPPGKNEPVRDMKPLAYSLCECAYLLMPLDWIKWSGQTAQAESESKRSIEAVWRYRRYDCRENQIEIDGSLTEWGDSSPKTINGDESSGSLGMKWKLITEPADLGQLLPVTGVLQTKEYKIQYAIKPPSSPSGSYSISKGAARLAIEQQLALGEMFRKQEQEKWQMVVDWVISTIKQHFADAHNLVTYNGAKGKEAYLAEHFVSTLQPTNKRLEGELKIRFKGNSVKLSTLIEWLPGGARFLDDITTPSIPFRTSLYLELGPIKALTHPGAAYWNENERPLWDALANLVQPVYPNDCGEWSEKMNSMGELAKSTIVKELLQKGAWKPTRQMGGRKEPFDVFDGLHKIVRSEYVHKRDNPFALEPLEGRLIEHIRTPTGFPFRPCFPIVQIYGDSFVRSTLKFAQAGSCQLFAHSIRGSPAPHLTEAGFRHTKPAVHQNVFALRFTRTPHLTFEGMSSANDLSTLSKAIEKHGRILIGFGQSDELTTVRDITGETCGDLGIAFVDLRCHANEAFVAIVVDTVRLEK